MWHLTSNKSTIFISIITSFILVSCDNSTGTTKPKDGWNRFTSDTYQIDYPQDWEINQSTEHGTDLAILSEKVNADDQFRENVNLVIQNLKGKRVSLDKYTEVSLAQIKKQMPDAKILIDERVTLNNIPCHKIIYTGNHVIYDVKFEQYFMIIDEIAYVLTYTSHDENYEMYKDDAFSIINSFSLKDIN